MSVVGKHNPLKGAGLKVGQQFDVIEEYAALLTPYVGDYSFSYHDCWVLCGGEMYWVVGNELAGGGSRGMKRGWG